MFRRAFHLSFTILSAMSQLIFFAVCVLWVRSYRVDVFDRVVTVSGPDANGVQSRRQDLVLSKHGTFRGSRTWFTADPKREITGNIEVEHPQFPLLSREPRREPSFDWEWEPDSVLIIVPYWALAAATLPLPAAYLYSALRRHRFDVRRRLGHCAQCGYDVRESPERCPECGTTVKTVA